MRLLLNCSTIQKGGALQAAFHWIKALPLGSIDLCLATSRELHHQLAAGAFGCNDFPREIFDVSPARNINARRRLLQFERRVDPDAVLTLFGPAYVDFGARHVLGFANGWITHPSKDALAMLNLRERVCATLRRLYARRHLRRANAWVVETETARRGLIQLLDVDPLHVHVIGNCCGPDFVERPDRISERDTVRLLYVSAYYRHKNFEIVPDVARQLRVLDNARRYQFSLTLLETSAEGRRLRQRAEQLGVSQDIILLGQVPVATLPAVYAHNDIAFLPSHLETFSATYPEAMFSGLPIVASDYNFARDICGDAATYFAANSPRAAALSIMQLTHDDTYRSERLADARKVRAKFLTIEQRVDAYQRVLAQEAAEAPQQPPTQRPRGVQNRH